MVPKIVIAGILDTKGREIRYLAEQVKAAGGEPVILELSLSGECGWADIGLGEVLKTTGHSVADVAAVNRSDASKIVVEAADKMVRALYREGKLHGMIGYGGSMGARAGAKAFRQAIDAVKSGLGLEEAGRKHKELGMALDAWGIYKPPKKSGLFDIKG